MSEPEIRKTLKHKGVPVTHLVIVLIPERTQYADILLRKQDRTYFLQASVFAEETSETIERIARHLTNGFDVPVVNLGVFENLEFISETVDPMFWEERQQILLAYKELAQKTKDGEWLLRMADKENNQIISAGGLVTRIEASESISVNQ